MKYQDKTFTMPVNTKRISDLEYALRVGNITQAEYDAAQTADHQPTEGFTVKGGENLNATA